MMSQDWLTPNERLELVRRERDKARAREAKLREALEILRNGPDTLTRAGLRIVNAALDQHGLSETWEEARARDLAEDKPDQQEGGGE
jgi:F420-0:gamma-glutamyl ligase